MGHHEDIVITITAGGDTAAMIIPHEVRQLLELGGADALRDKLKELLAMRITEVVNRLTAEQREQLNQMVEAKRQELMAAWQKIQDSN